MRAGGRVHSRARDARRAHRGKRDLTQAIVVQSFVAAPAGTVWAALRSRTDVLFDGLPAQTWPEGTEEQPPYGLRAPWPFTQPLGRTTSAGVVLHEMGEGVRVDVRHEGWGEGAAWDTMIQGHFAGWLQGLAAIGLLVETGVDARGRTPGGERYFISGEIPAEPSAVFRSLTDPAVLARWSGGALDGAEAIERIEDKFVRWRAAGEVTAILRHTPRGTHLAIAEYGVDRAAPSRWPGMFENLARFLR